MRDQLMDSFLAIAPHFTLHRESCESFLLFAEDRSLRLRGAFYGELLALLDGGLKGREILARLGTADAADVLARLVDEGQVVTVPRFGETSRQAFWSAGGRGPQETETSLARFGVAVRPLGSGAATGSTGAAAMLATLVGSGLGVRGEETADLVLLLVDDYLDPALTRVLEEMADDRCLLPVKPAGRRALIGPLLGGGHGRCPACLVRRLAEHRPHDALVASTDRALRPAKAWTAASLELARASATTEIVRLALGEDPDVLLHVLALDTGTGRRQMHRHWPFLDCPRCATAPRSGDAVTAAPIRLDADPAGTVDTEIGGWRTLTAEQALERLEPLVSNLTGIIADIQPARDFDQGLFVYTATQANPTGVDPLRNRRVGTPGGASGKGMTPAQARVSCLAEAVERYSGGWVGTQPRRCARLADLGADAWHPHRLLNFSDRQYDGRGTLNAQTSSLHQIPERFDEDAEIDWSPVWSLTNAAVRWLPTRYCYFDYRADSGSDDRAFCFADSNGCASGATLAEAILQGLLEVVERDAVAIWWYNRLRRPGIALEGINDAFVERMLTAYEGMNRNLHLLDLTADTGIPAAVAVSSDRESGGRVLMGFGAHADPRIAAERALTELNQILLLEDLVAKTDGRDAFGDELRRWLLSATLESQPYLAPADEPLRQVADMARLDASSIEGAIAKARDRLAALGLELLVLNYARSDMPLACVKVVVPGMRHFWARRGPGRLYEVPVTLGWLDRPHGEQELNPINFVF